MEKTFQFGIENLEQVCINVAWPHLEVHFSDREELHMLMAGDESSLSQMKVDFDGKKLFVEQPQFGLFKNYMQGAWMQIILDIPKAYRKLLDINSVQGSVLVRAYSGEDLRVDTVSGKIIVNDIQSELLSLGTVSGSMTARNVTCEQLKSKSVSGMFVYENLQAKSVKASSVSAKQYYELFHGFEHLDINSVSGNIEVLQPYDKVDAKVRAISSSASYVGVELESGAPKININIVSGNVKIKKVSVE